LQKCFLLKCSTGEGYIEKIPAIARIFSYRFALKSKAYFFFAAFFAAFLGAAFFAAFLGAAFFAAFFFVAIFLKFNWLVNNT
jgi:ABC-type Co2+ transport system permease subunit